MGQCTSQDRSARIGPLSRSGSGCVSPPVSPAVVNTVGHVVINSAMEIRSLSERLTSMANSEAGLADSGSIREDLNAITSTVESMISSLHQNLAFANQGMNSDIHQLFEMKAARFFSLFDGILWAPKNIRVEWDHIQHAQTIDLITNFDPRIVQMHVVSMLGNRKVAKDSVESREDAYQSCIRIASQTGHMCRMRVEFFKDQQEVHLEDRHIVLPLFSGIETDVTRIKDGTRTKIQVSFNARFLNEQGSGITDVTSTTTTERRAQRCPIRGPSSLSHFDIAGLDVVSSSATSSSGEHAPAILTLDITRQISSERTFTSSLRRLTTDRSDGVDNRLAAGVMSPRPSQPKPGSLIGIPPHRTILKNERHLHLGPPIARRDKFDSTAAPERETCSTTVVRAPQQLPPLPPHIKVRSVTGGSVGGYRSADFCLPDIKDARKPPAFSVRDRGVPSVKVLVVDDEIACIKFVVHALVQIPEVVTKTASDGIEAIRQACQFFPDIIFMDISMPQCDGIEAASRIHQVYGLCNLEAPKIYIVSANLDSVNRIKKDPESYVFVSDAFEKPLDRKTLQHIVLDRVTKSVGSP